MVQTFQHIYSKNFQITLWVYKHSEKSWYKIAKKYMFSALTCKCWKSAYYFSKRNILMILSEWFLEINSLTTI